MFKGKKGESVKVLKTVKKNREKEDEGLKEEKRKKKGIQEKGEIQSK